MTRATRDETIDELRMSEGGERVLRQVIDDRERREREARHDQREARREEERRRLGHRFARTERVVYHDDEYRR